MFAAWEFGIASSDTINIKAAENFSALRASVNIRCGPLLGSEKRSAGDRRGIPPALAKTV